MLVDPEILSFPLGWFKEEKLMIWQNSIFFIICNFGFLHSVDLQIEYISSLETPKDN